MNKSVKPAYGATDAGRIALSRAGIPSGVVSVPCRYIHAPVAMLSVTDVLGTIELVTRFCALPPGDLEPAGAGAAPAAR